MNDECYGKIWVYEKPSGAIRIFIYEELIGNFIKTIPNSSTVYLETGRTSENWYARSVCRKATPEEIEGYKKILNTSKYSKNILQTIKERNIVL